ncbi:hypothetical protein AB0H34_24430 [Saccharopolyspora shandongensis]|uniref:hypothetical protein n=1 Tax=Saccharopolyspora shandongensis TaxID=418495 RepID=UPI003401E4E9
MNGPFSFLNFESTGWMPAVHLLFGYAVGSLLGTVLGRSLPANAVVNGNGDGFSSVVEPNSTRERQAEGFTTVRFSVNGKVVNAYGPLEAGRTLVCNAGGTAAAPTVKCAFA